MAYLVHTDVVAYVEHTLYGLECDECGRRTCQDDWYLTKGDAEDLGGIMIGWLVWHRKDGTVKHICPDCAEKKAV